MLIFGQKSCVRTKTACYTKIKYWLTFYLLLSYLTPLTYFRRADFEWFATTNFASDLLCLSPTFAYCYQYDLNRNELAERHRFQLFCATKNSRINIARHNAEYHHEKEGKENCNSLVHRIAGFIFYFVCLKLGYSLYKVV